MSILQRLDYGSLRSGSLEATHLVLEASRLAAADRRRWVADPDHVEVPTRGLVDSVYLDGRVVLDSWPGSAHPRHITRMTLPARHASVASARDLNTRTAQSHWSSRIGA